MKLMYLGEITVEFPVINSSEMFKIKAVGVTEIPVNSDLNRN